MSNSQGSAELARRLGFNDAKTKMLMGQSLGDLAGLERKLLNELDGSSREGSPRKRRQEPPGAAEERNESNQWEPLTSNPAGTVSARWISGVCRRVPLLKS